MKTSKITECVFSNTSSTKFGVYYYHKLTFENGDYGNIGTKEQNPDKISVGKVLTYEIVGDKIKIVSAEQQPAPPPPVVHQQPAPTKQTTNFPKQGYTKKPEEFIGYVLGYAKDIVCAKIMAKQKITDEAKEVNKLADAIYEQVKKMLHNS